jgi:hypothetical protein
MATSEGRIGIPGAEVAVRNYRVMNAAEGKQKAIDALLARFRDALDPELVEGAPPAGLRLRSERRDAVPSA